MGFIMPNFKDLTMKTQNMDCKIWFSRFNGRFKMAQIWLDRKMIEKMQPVIPRKTGQFREKINVANVGKWGTGEIVTSVPPQGRYLYPGISFRTGKPFKWTNPLTQPRWGTYTYQTYKSEFNRGIKDILIKGKYPNG